MASIGWEGKRARIVFRDEDGKQQSIRLGECPKDYARSAKMAIGHLVIAKRHNGVLHPDAVRWLGGIDEVLYARVVAHGLCQPREGAAVVTLANLLDRFDAAVAVKPTTQYKYRQVADSLRAFLGADAPLASITPGHADNWRKSIAEPKANPDDKTEPAKTLARATVAKRVVIAKGVFRKAVRWGYIASNPFADLRAGSQSNPDRAYYVTVETIRAILAVCPDDQWRAIIALSRFAGLRCPSEVVGLRWGDIVWDKGRMTVRSPKTANHEGHAVRVVPIAPELRPILQDLFDRAEVGAEAVVPRLRDPSMNLRTQFERIIGKAGVKPWPRLFHNMRASCATDWVERFPAHVVAGWLGHSPMIAAQHYLQTRDAHFDLAAGVGEAAANPATHTRPSHPTGEQGESKNTENPAELVGCGVGCDPVVCGKMPPEGLEPTTR
ncbi:MAG: site-specific integrase [Phycisphaeraceae bacterium]|nr:site-specific integrase [Phycisphaerae bacterium]MBX3392625.1 site-specific integrase [Phycisphaeraceae bacterium]